ncbi:MAG: hypothetical protein VX527_06010 [Planctomycetota bacterium]|nr:hypothetical protein [Planctomycetota bacterium]
MTAAVLPSCTPAPNAEGDFARAARVTAGAASDPQERLRDELGEFMVYFDRTITRLKNNAIRLADGNQEELQTIRSTVLLIERKFTEAYAQPDSYVALIELWYDAYRLNAWRWEYEKRNLLLLKATGIAHILNRIRHIARRWTQPETFNLLDEKIREKASIDEQKEDFVDPKRMLVSKTPVLVSENDSTGIVSVLGLPFAPFAAADSISRTAAEMGVEARRIADRVDRLPSDRGHQAEMIVLEVLTSPQVEAVLLDLEQLSLNFARISDEVAKLEDVVDGLPTRVREESLILLESLDGRSEELITINRSLKETFESGGQTLDSLAVASVSLNELTVQVEKTTLVLDELFALSESLNSDPDDKKDTLLELRQTVEAITETSQSLQNLLAAPDLENVIDRVDASIQAAALEADLTASKLVDRLTWRLAILLCIAFVLGAILVLIAGWQKRRLASRS